MIRFLHSFVGQITAIVILFGLVAVTLILRYQKDAAKVAPPPAAVSGPTDRRPIVTDKDGETKPAQVETEVVTRAHQLGTTVSKFLVPPEPEAPAATAPSIPKAVRDQMLAQPSNLTLYFAEDSAPPPKATVSAEYAPYGRLIRCKLVTALESSNLATPLIAITLESVWNRDADGVSHEIIPAGIEVHGPAVAHGRTRDRFEAAGNFVFVWRTNDEHNGMELPVTGIALTRDTNIQTGAVGPEDASAGIRGEVIETNSNRDIRLFVAAFLNAAASNSYETNPVMNQLTNQVVEQQVNNLRNAGISGVQAVLNEWASRIKTQIDKEGFYVAVPAGREFYLYVTQTIDLAKAQRGSIAHPPTTSQQ